LPERTGYRRASDQGRAASETTHPSLRERAERLAQSVIDFVSSRSSRRESQRELRQDADISSNPTQKHKGRTATA
jgi:hypothetical protein